MRFDGRKFEEMREVKIIPEVLPHAEGSAHVFFGKTQVICTASLEQRVPKWLMGSKQGWVTAEYGMLPRSTFHRVHRQKSLEGGRSLEISRLIGRSLRSALDLKKLGEQQIYIDCDVIQADGGTRTASITGGFVALAFALRFLKNQGALTELPLKNYISAVSVGINKDESLRNQILVDLNYDEDFSALTDMNVIMNNHNEFVEIQGATEKGRGFSFEQLERMLQMAKKACAQLFQIQGEVLKDILPLI